MTKEVEHESGLQGAHQEVMTLDVDFKLSEEFECLPWTDDSNGLQDQYDEKWQESQFFVSASELGAEDQVKGQDATRIDQHAVLPVVWGHWFEIEGWLALYDDRSAEIQDDHKDRDHETDALE